MKNKDMNIADVFKGLHGALKIDELIPLKEVIEDNFITEWYYKELVEYLEVEEKFLFYDPNGVLNPIIYLNDLVYIPLLDLKAMKFIEETSNIYFNNSYKEKIKKQHELFELLIKEDDWDRVFMIMDKKILIPKFIDLYSKIPPDKVYEVFVELYIRSEYGFEMFTPEFLNKVFTHKFASKDWKKRMSKLKKDIKLGKDNKFTIYHGHNPDHNPNDEYSWTLKIETAKFFANRFKANGMISKKRTTITNIIDYFTSRGEAEVIIKTNLIK